MKAAIKIKEWGYGRKKLLLFVGSLLTTFAFGMELSIFFVFILFRFYKFVSDKIQENCGRRRCVLFPAVLFALFMVVGYSYECTDSWSLVISSNILQWAKVIVSVCGYAVFFYYCIVYLFYKVDGFNIYSSESGKHGKILLKYLEGFEQKPALLSFISLLIFYIPYIIGSYPAIFNPDTVSQIIQAYAELGIYTPGYTAQSALHGGVYLNNHHPIISTLFIHLCLEIDNMK